MPTAFAIACAVLVALLLLADRRGHRPAILATKAAASIAFVLAGATALPLATTYGRFVCGGLVLSAVGDVLLVGASEGIFMAGIGAFLLAHIAYAIAFVARGIAPFAVEGAAFVGVLVAAGVLVWLVPHVPKKLRGPVFVYAVAITAMVALAVGTVARHGGAFVLVAAIAFYLSDLSVARDRFVAPGFGNRLWGLPLYYAAQLVFALLAR